MKKTVIIIIILASFAFSFVWWKIHENIIFSIISVFVGFVASIITIYSFFNKKNIVSLKEKEITEKERQIQQLEELRAYDKEAISRQKEELESLKFKSINNEYEKQIRILKAEIRQKEKEYNKEDTRITELHKEKAELERQLELAKKIIVQNKERDTQARSPFYKKAYSFFLKGDIEKALNVLSDENLEKEKNSESWFLKALLLETTNDHDKIMKCYEKVIELINPKYVLAYFGIGGIYSAKGNYDKAIEYYDKAIEMQPDIITKSALYYNKGNVYRLLENYDKAIECFEKSVELIPDFTPAYNNLGVIYENIKGDFEKSIKCYKKVIELKPNDAETYYNLCIVYCKNGNYAEGIKCNEKAIKLKPDFVSAYYNMGVMYGDIGNYNEEIKYYKKVIELNPNSEDTYNNMGIAYLNLGNQEMADDCFQKASMIRHNISFIEFGKTPH